MSASKQGIQKRNKKKAKKQAGVTTQPAQSSEKADPALPQKESSSRNWVYLLILFVVVVGGTYAVFTYAFPQEDQPKALTPKEKALAVHPNLKIKDGMVWIPGGKFTMGSKNEEKFADATHLHEVELDGFWMDQTEVTNAQFAEFVKATGYKTVAEQKPKWEEIKKLVPPGTPKPPDDVLVPGSLVFTPPPVAVPLNNHTVWWRWEPGADWRHPEGPKSNIQGRENHPVVHVCWEDAAAYAKWAKKRLPTEAEWEYAARGGLEGKRYVWGDEMLPKNKWQANIWQGKFPVENKKTDGFPRTAPVASYPPNGFGLFDVSGNVWEWCHDWYRPDYYKNSPKKNPQGPEDSFDPQEPLVPKRVQRGGSFLCSDQYCIRYLPAGRGKGDAKSGSSHIGFRCARSAAP